MTPAALVSKDSASTWRAQVPGGPAVLAPRAETASYLAVLMFQTARLYHELVGRDPTLEELERLKRPKDGDVQVVLH